MTKKEADKLQIIQGRINRGTIVDQKAWRFFISDEGASFDAGLAERAISAQKGIKAGGYRVVRKALEQA